MLRIYKNIIFILFLIIPATVNAHVQHYYKLNKIEFDIYRNNKHIGKHTFSFKKEDGQIAVESEINFQIKKLGVVLYRYHVKGTEYFKDGKLEKPNLVVSLANTANSKDLPKPRVLAREGVRKRLRERDRGATQNGLIKAQNVRNLVVREKRE